MTDVSHLPRSRFRIALFPLLCLALTATLVVAVVLSISLGAVSLPLERVVRIALHPLLPGLITADWSPVDAQIVWQFRLPRTLLAVVVGATLSVAGAALQAMVRNPLADPYIFGVSSGASVGAVAVLTLTGAVGGWALSLAAFTGALLSMTIVYLLARQGGRVTPLRLILAGVALGYVLSAVTSYLVLRKSGPGGGVSAVLYWLAGSLGGAKWAYLGVPAAVLVFSTLYLLAQARPLNALLAGDEAAVSLGLSLERFRLQLFLVTSLLVGVAVAVSGAIGFVGLMIPHLVRLLTGSDHRRVLPLCALLGGVFMVLVDLAGRTVIAPAELPVGIVTAILGGPFFLWMLRRKREL